MYVWTEAAEYKHVYTTPYHKAGLWLLPEGKFYDWVKKIRPGHMKNSPPM